MNDTSNQKEENLEDFINENEKSNKPASNFLWRLKVYMKNMVIIFFIGFLISEAYYINEESQRAVEMRFGKLIKITGPGLHFKLPFIESYHQYQLSLQRILPKDIVPNDEIQTSQEGIVNTASLDNYALNANIALLYRLPEEQVEYIHRNMPDFKQLLEYMVINIFKEEIGLINMIEVPKKRGDLSKNVIEKLKRKVQDINLKIELYDFSLPYYDWSEEFLADTQRMETITTAVRKAKSDKELAQEAAEKVKIEIDSKVNKTKAVAKVQNIKSSKIDMKIKRIIAATVDAEIENIRAHADADAIRIKGLAHADALKAQVQALVENPRLVELEKIKRWNGKLPDCRQIPEIFSFMNQTSNTLPTTLLPQSNMIKKP
ncbi:band 7 protein [Beggiatoa sp. PS]|nr:band 7 protein [Beggiatoa sp. PS]